METSKIRITVLWVAVICGFALHTLADLLPLFWDESITVEATGNAPVGLLTFMMTVSYLIPVIGVLLYFVWTQSVVVYRKRSIGDSYVPFQSVPSCRVVYRV